MIIRKSEKEIEIMREAGRIVAKTRNYLKNFIKPGVTTAYLDELAEKFILSEGATPSFKGYGGFPGSICTSINEVIVHGIPSNKRVLKDGDIISVDIGAYYKGYHGDSAWTFPVGNISDSDKKLLEITEKSLYIGLEQVKPGNRISDISSAIEKYVKSYGYDVPHDYTGHGVGKDLHEDPIIPNFGIPGRGAKIDKNMVFAVEPMVVEGSRYTETLGDDWTVITADGKKAAHFEHTVVVRENGYEILTEE